MGLAERFANVGRVTAPRKRAIAATSLGHGPRGDGRPHRTMPPRALCVMAARPSPGRRARFPPGRRLLHRGGLAIVKRRTWLTLPSQRAESNMTSARAGANH
jgi:hypothetical protein